MNSFEKKLVDKIPTFSERDHFVEFLEKKYFEPLRNMKDEDVHCPEKIPFVPYAYQTSNTRATIRASPILSDLHKFLISETAMGAIRFVDPFVIQSQFICLVVRKLFRWCLRCCSTFNRTTTC